MGTRKGMRSEPVGRCLVFHLQRAVGPGVGAASKGVAYCGEAAGKQRIEYHTPEQPDGEWDAVVTVNGTDIRAMTAYSYFGKTQPPRGFVVALLGEDHSEYLVFEDDGQRWLEFGDSRYDACD